MLLFLCGPVLLARDSPYLGEYGVYICHSMRCPQRVTDLFTQSIFGYAAPPTLCKKISGTYTWTTRIRTRSVIVHLTGWFELMFFCFLFLFLLFWYIMLSRGEHSLRFWGSGSISIAESSNLFGVLNVHGRLCGDLLACSLYAILHRSLTLTLIESFIIVYTCTVDRREVT